MTSRDAFQPKFFSGAEGDDQHSDRMELVWETCL